MGKPRGGKGAATLFTALYIPEGLRMSAANKLNVCVECAYQRYRVFVSAEKRMEA